MIQTIFSSLVGPLRRGYNSFYGSTRIIQYGRMKRVYEGFVPKNTTAIIQWKKLRYNPVFPIVNINASFLAANPIRFQIDGNPELTKKANLIWEASGGAAAFMENAVLGLIYGDAVIIPYYNEIRQEWLMKWIDASVCYPIFDPNNYDIIKQIDFIWAIPDDSGNITGYNREEWIDGEIRRYEEGTTKYEVIGTFDPDPFDGAPVAWIKNNNIKGQPFGQSDISQLVELSEEFDHLMTKQSEIIDYYANPNLYFKGVKKTDFTEKSNSTIYFLPENGEAGFIEWQGVAPGISEHIEQVRNQISEISATPKIAFSNFDFKFADISGVALKVLFGPLLIKTDRRRLDWGKGLAKAIRMVLFYETGEMVEPENITIIWQSPLPNNTKEDWEIATLKELLGVSKRQTLREQGYTEDQIDQMFEEREAEAKMEAEMEANKAKLLAEASGKTAEGKPGSGGLKEKADHVAPITTGKIVED